MPERLNENAYVSFPFEEDQVLRADTGEELPSSFLLDFSADIYLPALSAPRLTSITVAPGGTDLTATFTTILVGETLVRQILVPAGVSEWVAAHDILDTHWSAILTFGEGVNELCSNYPGQTLNFDLGFEASRTAYTHGHAVRSLSVLGSPPLTGGVKITEGYNMSVSLIKESSTLILSAQKGAGAGLRCGDPEAQGNCADLTYDINGLPADWYGNIRLEGGPGISVIPVPEENKIIISTSYQACKKGCKKDGA